MQVVVKTHKPDAYDGADVAILNVTEKLILSIDAKLRLSRMFDKQGFYGTKWWDYTPQFIACTGPESVGSEMSEDEFDSVLESNYYVQIPDDFELCDENTALMHPVFLTVTPSGFYWTGFDKHVGTRIETYKLDKSVIDEWAATIGCTEILQKARNEYMNYEIYS